MRRDSLNRAEKGSLFSLCLLLILCAGSLKMMAAVVVDDDVDKFVGAGRDGEAPLVNFVLTVKTAIGLQSDVVLNDMSKRACDL